MIEKNVCDNIIGTLLEILGKNKDEIAAQLDLFNMGMVECHFRLNVGGLLVVFGEEIGHVPYERGFRTRQSLSLNDFIKIVEQIITARIVILICFNCIMENVTLITFVYYNFIPHNVTPYLDMPCYLISFKVVFSIIFFLKKTLVKI